MFYQKTEMNSYHQKICNYYISENLPSAVNKTDASVRVDHWWREVNEIQKCSYSSKLALAFLSSFYGPPS